MKLSKRPAALRMLDFFKIGPRFWCDTGYQNAVCSLYNLQFLMEDKNGIDGRQCDLSSSVLLVKMHFSSPSLSVNAFVYYVGAGRHSFNTAQPR